MAPALGALADGGNHSLAELRTVLAERLSLTEDDLQAKIANGTPLFANRLHWAITYMYQAGLLSRPKRGVVRITGRGRKVAAAVSLVQGDVYLVMRYLAQGQHQSISLLHA